jgi:CHAT domain-containing protein
MCLGNMGALLYRLKDLPRATEALRKAIAIIEELRGDLSSIDVRSSFVSNKYYLYENLIGLLIDQNNPQEALMYVERAKSRSFLDMLGNKAIGESKQRTPQAQALIDEEKTLQERMSGLVDNPDSADVLALVIARHQQVLGELTRLEPEYASVKSIDPMPVKDLQLLLPDSSALVEYYLGDESSFVFVLKRDTLVARKLRIDPAFGLDSRIEQLRRKLYSGFSASKSALISEKRLRDRLSAEDAKAAWYNSISDASWQYDLVAMYSILIAPVQELLAGMSKLYIVPHGPLHHLPFQALIAPAGIDRRRDAHVARPHYFIEDHAVAYLPSASVLQFAQTRNQDRTASALIVGDPLYADPVYRKRPLVGALIEADSVASYFSGPTVLKREAATEQAVKDVIGSSRVVHFATHGELNKRDPLKSRILLAAANSSVPNDGNLTVGEVFNLDLRASLVTLSACQTAQVAGGDGKFSPGDDLVGLTRSFLYAGTPSVIASLWYVDDAATLAWMTCYYRSWTTAGMRKIEAAREAALEMLQHPGDPDWVFPYFWGAFIYFGAMEQH